MAHLIEYVKCKCGSKSSCIVYSSRNAVVGSFCLACGKKVLNQVKRDEAALAKEGKW